MWVHNAFIYICQSETLCDWLNIHNFILLYRWCHTSGFKRDRWLYKCELHQRKHSFFCLCHITLIVSYVFKGLNVCNFVLDGDPQNRGSKALHRLSRASSRHLLWFLADGLGAERRPGGYAHDTSWTWQGRNISYILVSGLFLPCYISFIKTNFFAYRWSVISTGRTFLRAAPMGTSRLHVYLKMEILHICSETWRLHTLRSNIPPFFSCCMFL